MMTWGFAEGCRTIVPALPMLPPLDAPTITWVVAAGGILDDGCEPLPGMVIVWIST
jgi:hypothetical protein